MIGRFEIDPPPIDDDLSQMVESHRTKTGQDYAAILFFGLWGTVDCSAEVRLYAGYRHLADHPEDGPAWLEVADAHLEAGEEKRALAIVDELLRLGNPNLYPGVYSEDPEAHRARILADSGNLESALEALDGLRGRHGESPVFLYTLGSVLHERSDFAAAASSYAEALEALEQYRLDLEEEDMEEDMGVDFPVAAAFINAAIADAKEERPFSGARPMDLSGFAEE